ncbi:hypothetical protein [Syntrophomonas wolfei]|uniref:hypothetical protein n=1 Tax=Syntrophomonas wolfei TaxID=863 RepID=UPI0023F32D99|nr:hypothetical protein [Syntrophomonas wolfei]
MKYYLMPLHTHPDHGYGMMGTTYRDAADNITDTKQYKKDWYSALPVCYLRRHSIELYLKSGIILFHKKFEINFENDSYDSEPKVRMSNGKWELLRKIHNIGVLYDRVNELINSQMEFLTKNTKCIWKFDDNFMKWINIVNGYDSGSDYFRYPVTRDENRDKRKNAFKENTIEGMQDEIASGKGGMVFVLQNSKGEITSLYNHDSSKIDTIYHALENASNQLAGFHAMVRTELFDGF